MLTAHLVQFFFFGASDSGAPPGLPGWFQSGPGADASGAGTPALPQLLVL